MFNVVYLTNPYPTPISLTDERESLNFKLKGTKDYDLAISLGSTTAKAENDLGSWGHEFIRSLAGEIGQEYNARVIAGSDPDTDEPFADLLGMVDVIVPFNVSHHAEAEAVDLLIEVQRLKKILELDSIDEGNYRRVCMYLIKTADFMSDPDDYAVSLYYLGLRFCLSLLEYPFLLKFSPKYHYSLLLIHCRRYLNQHMNYSLNNLSTLMHSVLLYVWEMMMPSHLSYLNARRINS